MAGHPLDDAHQKIMIGRKLGVLFAVLNLVGWHGSFVKGFYSVVWFNANCYGVWCCTFWVFIEIVFDRKIISFVYSTILLHRLFYYFVY